MKKSVSSRLDKCLTAILFFLVCPLAHTFAVGDALLKSAPVTLAWNPAEDPSVKGYGIYYGLTNQPATNHVNTGTNLSVTLFDLLAGSSYRFYAVSYNAAGNESVPSNELLLIPPALSRVRIARLSTGEFRLTLRAAPGSVCRVEYADTPNRSTWRVLGLATADANGDVVVIDPASPQQPSRFYRVARLSNPPFTLLELAKLPSGSMQTTLNGSPGTTWEIQYASSPVGTEWTTLTMVTASATGKGVVTDPDSAQHPSRFYRAVLRIDPPPFTRLQVARQSNGSMLITLNGSPGTAWEIQYSASPVDTAWTSLTMVTANATGDAAVLDPDSAQHPSRFYRAVLLANPPPSPRLQVGRQSNGSMLITLNGSPGTTWEIQYSASPVDTAWTSLTMVTANATGDAAVLDPDSAQHPSRFYRAVLLVNPPLFTRLQVARQSTGSMLITLNGLPGTTWEIQYSALPVGTAWTSLTMVTANATGEAAVLDPDSAQPPSRFYRAVLLVNPPPFTRLQVGRQSNGSMLITLNGSPGNAWEIQYATSPVSTQWMTFATVIANATGEASVTNIPPGAASSGFYRAWLK